MPLSGDRPLAWEEVLDWECDLLNRQLAGYEYEIELVYRDTFGRDARDLAKELTADPSIRVVIGPETSREALQVIPEFEKARKLLISPSATSDSLFRAFQRDGFFARTCQSDVAQVKAILTVLKEKGMGRFSLLYEDSDYGSTFRDWSGFFAREMGMEMLEAQGFVSGQEQISVPVEHALRGDPECLVAAAFPREAVAIKRYLDSSSAGTSLFLTDAGTSPTFINDLGEASRGVEGVGPAADPSSGFAELYETRFLEEPSAWAASAYDALLLASCVTARSIFAERAEEIDVSFDAVVSGNDGLCGSNPRQVASAIAKILMGVCPDINGAASDLRYDLMVGIDPLRTFYDYWKVEDRRFETIKVLDTEKLAAAGVLPPGKPAAMTAPSPGISGVTGNAGWGSGSYVEPGGDLWAVIVASSGGLPEYRHQSDALGMYQLLRANGLDDDRIILMIPDDIRNDPGNPGGGTVRNQVGGPDLAKGAVVDYSGEAVTADNLRRVLLGRGGKEKPMLRSDRESDVLVYISGSGQNGCIEFDQSLPLPAGELGEITAEMKRKGAYGRILQVLELSDGELAGAGVSSPGALCIAASSRRESSIPVNYDSALGEWLASSFSYNLREGIVETGGSIGEVFYLTYESVQGAHAFMINESGFGDIWSTRISAFFEP